MKKIIKSFFRAFGLELRKIQAPVVVPVVKTIPTNTMEAGMRRALIKWNIQPSTIIDLGAAAGTWTQKAMEVWPNSAYLLFEPLEERKPDLEKMKISNDHITPIFAAVGNRKGSVQFMVSGDLDGSGVYDAEKGGGNREVELTTIDLEAERLRTKGPFLIKFDTHGYEVPILEGASKTLEKTDLIIMECYGFKIADACLKFPEMCAHLERLGFVLADIVNTLRRPNDELFWQCDAFFIRNTHPALKQKSYT